MKIRVLHDNTGRLVAVVPVDTGTMLHGDIVAPAGHSVIDVDIPTQYENQPLEQLLPKLSVDIASKQLIVK